MPEVPTQNEPVLDARTRIRDHLARKYTLDPNDADPLLRLAEMGFDPANDPDVQISALKAVLPYAHPSVRSIDVTANVNHTHTHETRQRVQLDVVSLLDGIAARKVGGGTELVESPDPSHGGALGPIVDATWEPEEEDNAG